MKCLAGSLNTIELVDQDAVVVQGSHWNRSHSPLLTQTFLLGEAIHVPLAPNAECFIFKSRRTTGKVLRERSANEFRARCFFPLGEGLECFELLLRQIDDGPHHQASWVLSAFVIRHLERLCYSNGASHRRAASTLMPVRLAQSSS